MNNPQISAWLDDLSRQAKLRRGIVISGNVNNIVFNQEGASLPFKQVLSGTLENLGFKHVIHYSRVGGISGISESNWNELQSSFGSQSELIEGDDYDFDDESTHQSELESGQTQLTPQDFFAVAQRVMLNTNVPKVAFIVDWSNLLFGQVNALSEQERGWLVQLSQNLRDAADEMSHTEIDKVQSLMVFVCQGVNKLPPQLTTGNPQFAEVVVPLPNRAERQQAILGLSNVFNLDQPLTIGSRLLEDFVDLTDSLNLREINQLARLSRQQKQALSLDALVSLYRYGKKESPWEQLNYHKLKDVEIILKQRVKGQDESIKLVRKVLIRAFTGLSGLQHSSKSRMPKGALFFVGPTGVGKTELAKSLASFLFGDEDACLRFDMSEFNHEHADQRLVGAPPGYVGFEEGGQLTNAVKKRPFSLLLFDEIEKAHPRILDKFLQILEDGRLTDGRGETVNFSDTFIVFTSNIGASEIEPGEGAIEQFKAHVTKHFVQELKRPELLGRIGEANIVPFNFMIDSDFLVAIAKAKLEPLKMRLKEKWGISDLIFDDEKKALVTIVAQVNNSAGGRGVLNAMVSALFDPLAEFLFENLSDLSGFNGRPIRVVQAGKSFDFEIDL
ncbi:ATP-dependent Clp protease ATP-binding subunit [Shewanella sp. SG41-4]|uniref:AAA family ATPase n=1 Tax=Shewanella sp. SG41-4 TaxID=2760976 RepID=UPI001602BCEB|nr:AAA family ATPase [Shewanella sp. SG41-4]MBB1440115.1 ATP-dependent Clp protease ATP-binding subunit [Shewanella sp. SG41-4]